MAARTATAVRLPHALDARGRWIKPTIGARGICPDCSERVTAIVSDHYRNRFFRHTAGSGHHGGGSAGMSDEHSGAQAAIIDLFAGLDPHPEVHSTGNTRRADVMITSRGQRIVIEVQRSNMLLDDMEDRTRDWNQDGAAVLWVFTSSMMSVARDGSVRLASTAYRWSHRRGWGQCYIVDRSGTLWWVDLREDRSRARPIERGLRSRTGRRAMLVVDKIAVNHKDPLVVAAFGWMNTIGRTNNPFGLKVPSWSVFGSDAADCDTTPDRI